MPSEKLLHNVMGSSVAVKVVLGICAEEIGENCFPPSFSGNLCWILLWSGKSLSRSIPFCSFMLTLCFCNEYFASMQADVPKSHLDLSIYFQSCLAGDFLLSSVFLSFKGLFLLWSTARPKCKLCYRENSSAWHFMGLASLTTK